LNPWFQVSKQILKVPESVALGKFEIVPVISDMLGSLSRRFEISHRSQRQAGLQTVRGASRRTAAAFIAVGKAETQRLYRPPQ
jgi:hypothetical protein